ncbi:hypothetical protein [Bacillus massiliigorillae]|uniref:hypothetical protein n=1 Tax=Bacillus massiliigorillae TaxID=1243664 RepID=UPI00039DC5F1|nr:hypothetical protein [Bacillus massiliigorillae]
MVIDQNDILKRQQLRNELLLKIYKHHYDNNSASFKVTESEFLKNNELKLACSYLEGKGYITNNSYSGYWEYKPTPQGIDYVESYCLK